MRIGDLAMEELGWGGSFSAGWLCILYWARRLSWLFSALFFFSDLQIPCIRMALCFLFSLEARIREFVDGMEWKMEGWRARERMERLWEGEWMMDSNSGGDSNEDKSVCVGFVGCRFCEIEIESRARLGLRLGNEVRE
jgi:hypothetical protein